MPELDRKVNEIFAGKVVRKDLVRQVNWSTCWASTVPRTIPSR